MTPASALLTALRECGATVAVVNGRLRVEAPRGAVTDEMRRALERHQPELVALVDARDPRRDTPHFEGEGGDIAAVLLRGTVIGDCWLLADQETLGEYPELLRSGRPVVFFEEVEQLRGKTKTELQAIGLIKTVFPTGRVLQ